MQEPEPKGKVPVLKELPPIKAYSTTSNLDPTAAGFAQLVADVLANDRYLDS